MRRDAKIHVQPERKEKLKGHKPPIQSQKTATPDLANLTQTGLQDMSPDDILTLQRTLGNRAVARLMAQRPGEVGEEIVGPRSQYLSPADALRLRGMIGNRAVARLMAQRQDDLEEETLGRTGEVDEEIVGPRMKPLREDAGQQRGSFEMRSSAGQRGLVLEGASDASHLDGEGLYGWDRAIRASDVANLVNDLVPDESAEDIYEPERIIIFSGTHGTRTGNLVNTGAGAFVGEDQATAESVMAENPGVEIEVIDVNSYTAKDQLTSSVFDSTNYIRIAAWCYSQRSYHLGDAITANWWPAPESD